MIWLNHHGLFQGVRRVDNGLFWLNANLLLWTSFTPFPTALMGDYPANALAIAVRDFADHTCSDSAATSAIATTSRPGSKPSKAAASALS